VKKFTLSFGMLLLLTIITTPYLLPVQASPISSSIDPNSSVPVSSEIPPSSEDNTIVLAVNEPVGFQSSTNYSTNYRAVGSTSFNNTNKYVYLSNGPIYSAGSFFTKNKVFLTNSVSAGFSTFFEMSVFGSSGYADGFTFIVSRDINVLGQAGGAIGYGGINNSIAVLFDNYDNGGQPPLCLSLGVNGGQGNCQYSGYYSGNFKIWIDYARNTNGGRLEVRMHNANNFTRPVNPSRAWDNITFDQIGNEFYTGFTASTGGFSQVAYLKSWYFSASYSPNGIDPTDAANFVTDNVPPSNPRIEPFKIGNEWFFKPDPNFDSETNLSYLYTFGNNQEYAFFNPFTARASFNSTDQTLYLYALDLAGNRSPGAGTYPYFRANYVLNYPGAQNVTSFYPGFNATYPVTQNVDLLLPVRPGYRFEGWALSPVQSTNLINQYTFNGNANFFARWAFLPYTVVFDTNGGTTIDDVNTNINLGFSLPSNPTKPNHQFDGWYLDEAFTQPLDLNEFPHTNLTLYAKWIVNTHTLTIEHEADETTEVSTFDYGTTLSLSSLAPTPREGFVFAGYYQDAAFEELVTGSIQITGDQTIYAKWIDLRPVIQFENDVQSITEPLTTSLANQDALQNARNAYNQLSEDQKAYVSEEALAELTALEAQMADLLAVEAVVTMIDDLPRIIQLEDQALLAAAIQAYANLTPAQVALFPTDRLHHLNDLSQQYSDLSEANHVETMVWEIPTNFSVDNIEEIQAAVLAYDALLPEEIAMMDPVAVAKLNTAKGQLNLLIACRGLIELIEAIGPEVSLDDESRIAEAFAYFETMSAEELKYLDMQYYQFLLTYSKTHQDMTIALPVNDLLSSLPTTITLDDEAIILEALAAYESLSSDQQQYIDEAYLDNLRFALNELDRLKNIDEGGGGTIDPPPVDPPIDPPVVEAYFPWIIIIVLVTWIGAYALTQKKPILIP
jgi:uncharacterized repeat protein (TIGR02543 family)